MNFPMLAAETLEGRRFMLPHDLEGTCNVVVITFQQRQQVEVETWLPLLHRLSAHDETLRYYLLPTIQFLPDCQHHFFDMSRSSHLYGQHGREHTLPLYVDLNDFNRALDIPTVSQIYTLLLDGAGKLLWRTSGGYTPDCGHDLIRLLDRLSSTHSAHPAWAAPLART